MQSSKRSMLVTPLSVEADQKEIIIAHLREEIYLLKRNEQELFILQEQYQALDHRLKALLDEKVAVDRDFKDRHDQAIRSISQLKNEADALRADLRQRNIELGDLISDENTLIGQLDQRTIEISNLKNELNSLLTDSEEMLNEKLKLEQTASGVAKDNQQIAVNIRELASTSDTVKRKTEELEKLLAKKKTEQALLKEKILSYENENNDMDADITTTNEDIAKIEIDTSKAQNELSSLQASIAEAQGQADKHKSDGAHYYKCTQAEVMRNNDLAKQLNQAENTHRLRANQIAEGNTTIQQITAENTKLGQANDKLRNDIELCRKHLESLSLLNSEIVLNLQQYSQEDDVVRNLIDRKARVLRARNRLQEAAPPVRAASLDSSVKRSRRNY